MKGIEQFVQVDAATLGALKYAGTWNASTNTPTLASGVGVQGQYYVVSVSGSTNLDGETNWQVGDWAVFNGSVWQKVDGGSTSLLTTLTVTGNTYLATTSGNVGIGTSSPDAKLRVNGAAKIGEGAASNTSKLMVNTVSGVAAGIQLFQDANESWIIQNPASTTALTFANSGTERMRITSAGDVGIGTTSPAQKLDVANGFVIVGANSANPGVGGNVRLRDDTGAARWLSGLLGGAGATAYSIYDIVAGAERLTINSTGDVGIGTSSPAVKLDVSGTINANSSLLIGSTYGVLYGDTGNSLIIGADNGNTGASTRLQFNVDGTERMRIDSSGNVGIGTTSPRALLDLNATRQVKVYFGTAGTIGETQETASDYIANNLFVSGESAGTMTYTKTTGDSGNAILQDYSRGITFYSGVTGNTSTTGTLNNFERMRLDASGDLIVGGTTTNSIRLTAEKSNPTRGIIAHVSNTGSSSLTGSQIMFTQNTVNNWAVGQPAGVDAFAIWSGRNTAADGTERARIDASGNLLVGKTTASGTTVGPELLANGQINAATANLDNLNIYNTTAAAYRFYVNAAGTVFATNTTISAISDQRLKENVQDLDAGLDKIMALKPRKFDWKAGKGKDIKGDRGFIAQEFEQVFPDLIDEWKDQDEGEDPYKSVRQDLIPVLVKAIQELKAEVDSLKAQLGA